LVVTDIKYIGQHPYSL